MANIPMAAGFSKPATKIRPNMPVAELTEIQNALKNLGYYQGNVGDPYGLALAKAVADFQVSGGYGPGGTTFTTDMWYGLLYVNDLVVRQQPLDVGVWNTLAGARGMGLSSVVDPNAWSYAPQGAVGVAPGNQMQAQQGGAPTSAPVAPAPPPVAAPDMTSAYAGMDAILSQYGLGAGSEFDLRDWARAQAKGATYSPDVFKQDLMLTDAYVQRYGNVNQQRLAKGLPALTPAEILEYESGFAQTLQRAGAPTSFYDNWRDYQTDLAEGTSLMEIQDRTNVAKQWAYSLPPEVKQAYSQITGAGDLQSVWAYVLNPTAAAPLIEHQLTMAEIMGAGSVMDIGVDQQMADRLANMGVDYNRAQQGFGQLDQVRTLFSENVGEQSDLTLEGEGIAAQFGTAPGANAVLERRAATRQASVTGGGGAERTQRGIVGLGEAR